MQIPFAAPARSLRRQDRQTSRNQEVRPVRAVLILNTLIQINRQGPSRPAQRSSLTNHAALRRVRVVRIFLPGVPERSIVQGQIDHQVLSRSF